MPDLAALPAAGQPSKAYMAVCNGCGARAESDDGSDLDALVRCAPDSGCCQIGHDHAAAANSCTTDHSAHACATPDACPLWLVAHQDGHLASVLSGQPLDQCPGGHCGLGVEGCSVCRPLTIFAGILMTSVSGA